MGLRLAKNPNIVEIGEDGIWLEQNRIYIPRNRIKEIYTAQNETYVQHAMVTIKTNDIALTVTFTEKEYKETFKYNPFIKPMYSDENYKYIKLILPQTRGTIDEIGLNISKRELIQKLHTLIA